MACSDVQNSSAVTLEDCTCPICMSILIQPVTMPCTHELCMPCFRKTVEEANLCCPMCRLRIATWARLSTKQKTLVNEIRWKQIQNLFPEKVKRRQEGKDDINDEDEPIHHPIVNIAEPGEIRKEYEEQLKRLAEQRQEERCIEEAESADLIKKLQIEEEERVRELERQAEEQRIKDEEIARKLAESAELSLLENGDDSMLEISPKLTRTHSTSASSKQNNVQTLDSFFFNKSSTDTSLLEDSPDIAQSSSSTSPQKSKTSLKNNHISSPNTLNKLEDMPDSHREFVKNQFHVMSNYSSVNKSVDKSIPATVTSETMITPLNDNDTSKDEDSSMIFPPVPSPSKTSPTPSEFSITNLSPTKKVVGLFPLQVSAVKMTEKQNRLCSKHVKMKHKNISINAKVISVEHEKEDSNLPKPVSDKTVSFVDSDYESDEDPSKSASNSVLKKNSHARQCKNKHSILSSESDSASEDSQSPKTKKVLKKRKSKPDSNSILSPQRSIKEWLSPISSKVPEISNSQDALESETSPKKLSKKLSVTSQKLGKNSSKVTKSLRKTRTSKGDKVERLSRHVSKSLLYDNDDSNPLTSKDNILNTEKTVGEVRKSRKSKIVPNTDSVPSPSKRRRKRSHKSSDDDSENSESVSRSRSQSRKSPSKLTVISEGETTPKKKSGMSLDSEDEFMDTSKAKTSSRKTVRGKASINSPKKKVRKPKSPEIARNIEKQVSEKRKSALVRKQTKLDFDSVFTDNDKTEPELDDFELALKLQREFDNEAKLANRVDRSKGSESEYSLRHKSIQSPAKTK